MNRLAWIAAVLAAFALYAYAFSAETPVGSLRGRVMAHDTGQPLAGIHVVLRPTQPIDGADAQRLKTDAFGVFEVNRLAAGAYDLETTTGAYQNVTRPVTVHEGEVAPLEVTLKPGDPYLNLNIHQRAFLPSDNPRISLNGFRQGEEIRLRLLAVEDAAMLRNNGTELRALLTPMPTSTRSKGIRIPTDSRVRMVREWTHPVKQKDAEGVFYDFEHLGRQKPGLYLLEARGSVDAAVGWLLVTDLALITKSAAGRVIAYTTDLRTGKPVPSVDLTFFGEHGNRTAKTNAQGIAELNLPASAGAEFECLAREGNSIAYGRFRPYGYQSENGPDRYRVLTYTDRPVYRPGHKVQFKGVARRLEPVNYSLPSPQEVQVSVKDEQDTVLWEDSVQMNERGAFAGHFDLSPEARSGNYYLTATIDGEEHTDTFAIASYRKPEWRVDVEPGKKNYVRGEQVPVTIRATYYYGAPVVEGQVHYTVYRSHRYSWWDEDEEESDAFEGGMSGDVVASGDAMTDQDGTARFDFSTTVTDDPDWAGDYDYSVEAEVTDASDRYASGNASVRVSAGELTLDARPSRYVAAPGDTVKILVQAKDLEDRPAANVTVTAEATLDLWTAGRVEQRRVGGAELHTDAKGKAEFPVTLPEPGLVVARVTTRDGRGNTITSTTDVWVTTEDGGDYATNYPALSLLPDKKSYRKGDTMQVLVNTDRPGATALVAVESDRIHDYRMVTLTSKSTVVRFKIQPGYEPNVFVTACMVKGREFTSTEAKIMVNAEGHRLKIDIRSDREVYRPGDTATYTIRTTNAAGKPVPAEVSFGVVDEAVYAIREEPKVGLWETFYPRRRNEVITQFSYPEVYLGDADKDAANLSVRKNFPDTAYWNAFLTTDASGQATVKLRLPDNLTSWRATAMGHTAQTEVGKATHNLRVMRDLTLRLQTPRFLTEGDRLTLSAVVHNYTAGPLEPSVRLQATGLNLAGNAEQKVRIDPGGSQKVTWDVTAPAAGKATVTATASAGTLSDGMQLNVPVVAFARKDVKYKTGAVSASAATEEFPLDPNAVRADAELRLSPTLAGALLGSLEYLTSYPHGCTEQTMSSFLPDVVVLRALKGLGLQNPNLVNRLPEMTQAGLLRLYRYQHADGGWGWWEYDETDPWMTAYVLFGLVQARGAGVDVSEPIYKNGLEAGLRVAEDAKLSPETGTFLSYVLALAHKDDAARKLLKRFEPNVPKLQRRSQGYRLLALATLGSAAEKQQAARALEELWTAAEESGGLYHWTERRSNYSYSMPADVESTAVILKAAVALTPDDSRLNGVVRWLLLKRQGNKWESTRDTAFILFALTDYLKATGELSADYTLTVLLNGKEIHTDTVEPGDANREETIIRIPKAQLQAENRIEIRKDGRGALYYALQVTQEIPVSGFMAESTAPGVSVKREYFRLETQRDANGHLSVVPEKKPTTQLKVGDRILVRLTVQNDRPLEYLMLEDPLPSGCEAQDRGQIDPYEWSQYYWWSHMDIRDDRVNLFIRSLDPSRPNQPHVLEYYLRPEMNGQVRALPTVLSDMYVPSFRASTPEAKLEVGR